MADNDTSNFEYVLYSRVRFSTYLNEIINICTTVEKIMNRDTKITIFRENGDIPLVRETQNLINYNLKKYHPIIIVIFTKRFCGYLAYIWFNLLSYCCVNARMRFG